MFTHDIGMYGALVAPVIPACTVPGPYRIPNIHSEFRAAYINLQPTSAARGAGRPQGVLVIGGADDGPHGRDPRRCGLSAPA